MLGYRRPTPLYCHFLITLFLPLSIILCLVTYLRTGFVHNLPYVLHSPRPNDATLRSEVANATTSFKKEIYFDDYNKTYYYFNYFDSRTLTYRKRIYSNNVEVLFRLPENVAMSALLLIFPGCSHTRHDWFHTNERQRIIGGAIDLGFGCIAFQATNDLSLCWSTNADISKNRDVQMVFEGLEGFFEEFPKLGQ